MRTTIRLNDNLFNRIKKKVLQENTTFTAIVENALRVWLSKKHNSEKTHKVRIPCSGSGGLQAGVNLDNTSGLLDRMEKLS